MERGDRLACRRWWAELEQVRPCIGPGGMGLLHIHDLEQDRCLRVDVTIPDRSLPFSDLELTIHDIVFHAMARTPVSMMH